MAKRAIVADDHPMCREAAKIALSMAVPGIEIAEAETLAQVLSDVRHADIVLLDLQLPDSKGMAGLIDVARARRNTPILVVSGVEDEGLEHKLAVSGAAGFVSKSSTIMEISAAAGALVNGGTYFRRGADQPSSTTGRASRLTDLTAAESRVLRAMRGGELNKQIAHELGLSEITVKQHVRAILRKLGVANRTQAILMLHGAADDAA